MTELDKSKKFKKRVSHDQTNAKPAKREAMSEAQNDNIEENENSTGPAVAKKSGSKKERKKFEFQPLVKHKKETKWFSYQADQKVENPSVDKLSDEETKELFDNADFLLKTDQDVHAKMLKQQGGSEASWLLSVVKKGTSADRMTAMQLQMHNSPVHALPYVDSMIITIERKNTREVMEIIPLLEEIFVNHFLPESRKLLSFSSRPLAKLNEIAAGREQNRNRVLVLWMFEHKLKQYYERFIKALEGIAAGVVEDLAKRALKTAVNLLAERPESEQLLLTMLVNKLGHPNYKIGSYVSSLLEELTRRQPNMIPVIVKETERLVYRKHVSDRALLYATSFMSQIRLRNEESHVPVHLLSIYFGLFKTLVARKKTDNRLLGILLSASNRAFPFTKNKIENLMEDINALYKVVHTSSFPVALQTLKLLYQVLDLSDSLSDRFYSALYRKLFSPIPLSCYNQLMLLLFRVLKADASEDRIRSFIKRLLQIATGATPPLTAAILILVSRIAEKRPGVLVIKRDSNKVLTQVNFDEDDEEHYVDLDVDGKPVVKIEAKADENSDSENESEGEGNDQKAKSGIVGSCGASSKGGWVHKVARSNRTPYDPAGRNPLFIDAKSFPDTELLLLSKHFHPSVAIFAEQLLKGQFINYKGDPLEDYTLMKFLDRFAYKNPRGASKGKKEVRVARKKTYDPWGVRKLAINSKEYLEKSTSELPADERYLHKFAQMKFQPKEETTEKGDEWEFESVGSEEFDRIIDQFEPGEANDEFDVDFSQEFSAEKHRKKAEKRGAEEQLSDGEDDELDEEDYEDDDEGDGDEDGDEDDEDDEDVDMESDFEDDAEEERAFQRGKSSRDNAGESSDDEDFGENDHEVAADRFGAMLDDFEEEERASKKKGKISKIYKQKQRKRR